MGQVRWAGWTMAIATAFVVAGGQGARADVASDKPAALVVYPKIVVTTGPGSDAQDTTIRLTNTNTAAPINVHCFYVDANSHCTNDGSICQDSSTCPIGGLCVPGWLETDFDIVLTPGQPIEWEASEGLSANEDTGELGLESLPLPFGVCTGNQFFRCGTDADCNPIPGGICTPSNAGTRIPPVSEDPFVGELKCLATDANGTPIARNELKGEAEIETSTGDDAEDGHFDVASYNGIGIQATAPTGTLITDSPLTLGPGSSGDFNGCPNVLILNHFFDDASDPIQDAFTITTDLTLVPCTEDFLRQVGGTAVVQYLVYNEFEQRFSTSNTVNCFREQQLCNIDTPQCQHSIFNVAVSGTLTGQTRMSPIGSGLLGVAIEHHGTSVEESQDDHTAAFNLHFAGSRDNADTLTLP